MWVSTIAVTHPHMQKVSGGDNIRRFNMTAMVRIYPSVAINLVVVTRGRKVHLINRAGRL